MSFGEYAGRQQRLGAPMDIEKLLCSSYIRLIKAVGIKMFYEYHTLAEFPMASVNRISNLHVIHLIRDNALESFVSLEKAKRTSQWSGGQDVTSGPIKIDPEKCMRYMESLQRDHRKFKNNWSHQPLLSIDYESLVTHPSETLLKVQQFLGVTVRPLQSVLTKQETLPLSERISNYEEICRYIGGTNYDRFIQ